MVDSRFEGLLSDFRSGKVDRRSFVMKALAFGASASVIGSHMRASAQDATALGPGSIGTSVEHDGTTDKGTIKVYSSFPLSASYEQIGGDSREAIQFAIELWGGAAGGYAIEYVPLDDGVAANNGNWDGALEAENAAKAIGDADCMAYMATYNSGAAMVSIPLTNEAGLVMVSGANTAIHLTRPDPENPDADGYPDVLYPTGVRNYCRVIAADDLQGAAGANHAINELGRQRAFVLHDNQTYGKGLAEVFQRTFTELGGEVVGFEGYDANAPDYQALMSRIASLGPDIVYAGAIVSLNTSKVLIDMRDVMPDPEEVVFMGPDGLINQAFVDGAGEAAEGALLTFGGLPPESLEALGGAGAEWVAQMRERLGREPDAYASYWFQVAVVVLNGIDAAADKDRAKVLEAVMGTTDFQGLAGSWSFTETGDADAPQLTVNRVVDGVIKFDAAIAPPV
ncbi:MAG: branched-chain amino acid ABC transporter substrate-binding protein [Thermomicrobiales bacterium]|nr:branched-chain amino acid ABC transporter substrate-binding protein [Thermomicrobiales bacterium]MCO5217593.1 branched-chain amino acid ABC transporter substrate-binding protein [Thermomicrobiales bacterium]MCO5224101.1 branched-chain amino acid ABC transporter substrate-binding protein [Thermomicrobiales bacterium]MCO5226936.1 branched-chain amino acid ABC transporter substrate-binding protein [Thermomicrobiales bacterium]